VSLLSAKATPALPSLQIQTAPSAGQFAFRYWKLLNSSRVIGFHVVDYFGLAGSVPWPLFIPKRWNEQLVAPTEGAAGRYSRNRAVLFVLDSKAAFVEVPHRPAARDVGLR
jgi:hypothetical protein